MSRKVRRDEVAPVVEEMRTIIQGSDLSQRQIEELAGFSKGYLSQLLGQHLDLKMWHVLTILQVLDMSPADFFEAAYPRTHSGSALESFVAGSQPLADDIEISIHQLYRLGVESLTQMRMRLRRCEMAIDQLEARGVVHLTGMDFGRIEGD
jgi:hypothetical protein